MRARHANRVGQTGFALVLALFLIVSLAAIGAYLLTVSTAQVEAGVQDEQGARAYQAARTGIDWGAYQLRRNPGGAFASACIAAGVGSGSAQTLTLGAGLTGFYAQVACLKTGDEFEGADAIRTYRVTATGCNQTPCASSVGPTYVERQLQLTLTRTN